MSRFSGVLRQVSDGLDLPQPTKSRILLEMAGDLEDLYQHHLAEGLDEHEAARRADEAFAATDEELKRLSRLHRSSGLTDRVAQQVGSWWERLLLVIWVLAVLGIAGRVATTERFFRIVSPFLWPVVALAVAAFAIGIWKLYELSRRPPTLDRLRSGLSSLPFIAAASVAIALCGLFYHLQWWAFAASDGPEERVFLLAGPWILAVSSLMVVSLLTAVLASLVWFLLARLVARIEHREAEALLAT